MQDKVLQALLKNKLVNAGEKVVAAVSGGPDSVCLLHLLHILAPRTGIALHVIHINHMLRGDESDQDELYVRQLCKKLGVPLKVCSVDIAAMSRETGMSLEEAGREARYREFETYASETGAQKIAVAHNRNDQAETVMMHIIRGSGLKGLVGMEPVRGKIIRPLLDISRREVEEYCREQGLEPRTDSSNLKSDYARNRVRLELFPMIDKSFGSDIASSLCRMASLALEDHQYLEGAAHKSFDECLKEAGQGIVYLHAGKTAALPAALLGRVLRRAVEYVKGDIKGLENVHVDAIRNLAANGRTGSVLQLPGGIRAGLSYGILKVGKAECFENAAGSAGAGSFCRELVIPGITLLEGSGAVINAKIEDISENIDMYRKIGYNSLVQYFDYDLANKGIYVRNRREGDIFRPLGSNGTKKLKEFFIDSKIEREKRSTIPLVAVGREIVWMVGYKSSDKFKVTENTKRVLKLSYGQ